MSTSRGGVGRRGQKHQNSFAFKHNKNSKKTAKILSISHTGLCARCSEKIEWRKKFRKYKPIKTPKKCTSCQERKVKRAYHLLCSDCVASTGACAMCKGEKGKNDPEEEEIDEITKNARRANSREVQKYIATLQRERERRKFERDFEKGDVVLYYLEDGSVYLKRTAKTTTAAQKDEGEETTEQDVEMETTL